MDLNSEFANERKKHEEKVKTIQEDMLFETCPNKEKADGLVKWICEHATKQASTKNLFDLKSTPIPNEYVGIGAASYWYVVKQCHKQDVLACFGTKTNNVKITYLGSKKPKKNKKKKI